MSQRLFSFLFACVVFALIGGAALANGGFVSFGGDFEVVMLKVAVPLFLAAAALRNWYAIIDARVGEESLDPKDLTALLTITGFWIMVLSVGAVAAQLFNVPFLTDDTRTILVDGFVMFATLLLDTFARRTPGKTLPSDTIIAMRAQGVSPQKLE